MKFVVDSLVKRHIRSKFSGVFFGLLLLLALGCGSKGGDSSGSGGAGAGGTGATAADTTAPTAGTAISFSSVTSTTLSVNWGAATDDVTAQSNLEYKVVKDNVAAGNIDTIAEVDAKTGGDLLQDYTANITTKAVTGLTGSPTFHFAVVVRDAAGNKAIYAPSTQTVPAGVVINEFQSIHTTGTYRDHVEVLVTAAGTLNGITLREGSTSFVTGTIFTFPNLIVAANDLIIIHTDAVGHPVTTLTADTCETTKTQATGGDSVATAWDCSITDNGLVDTDQTLLLVDSAGAAVLSGVYFTNNDGTGTAGALTALNFLLTNTGWSPNATYTTDGVGNPNMQTIGVVNTCSSANTIDPFGASTTMQRTVGSNNKTKADWVCATGTFGAANPAPDTTAPTITVFSPANGSTGISGATTISVTFSEAMNATTVTTANLYAVQGTDCNGTALTGTITPSGGNTVFTFSPGALTASTQYTTCVKTGVQDAAGNALASLGSASFTTAAAGVLVNASFDTDTASCTVSTKDGSNNVTAVTGTCPAGWTISISSATGVVFNAVAGTTSPGGGANYATLSSFTTAYAAREIKNTSCLPLNKSNALNLSGYYLKDTANSTQIRHVVYFYTDAACTTASSTASIVKTGQSITAQSTWENKLDTIATGSFPAEATLYFQIAIQGQRTTAGLIQFDQLSYTN